MRGNKNVTFLETNNNSNIINNPEFIFILQYDPFRKEIKDNLNKF